METIKHMTRSSALFASLLVATSVHAGITQLATSAAFRSLVGRNIAEYPVRPRRLGRAWTWPYLPDWAGGDQAAIIRSGTRSFNGIAYNPAVNYTPPRYFDADGTPDTTTYPSQTTWTTVKNDGYGVQDDGTATWSATPITSPLSPANTVPIRA
jgi:hypothetical protein